MTAKELYKALKELGVDFDLIEIFEGSRLLRFEVDEIDEIKEGEGQ